jgi:hypothetical protein
MPLRCVCLEVCRAERCSNAVPLLIWTHCLTYAAGALPVCRANDPRYRLSVTGADAVQASAAVPSMKRATLIIVAIDQYAEAATGNRDFFLNKPPGTTRGDIA